MKNTAVVTVIPKSTDTEIPSGDIIHLRFVSCDLADDGDQKWVEGVAKIIIEESTWTEYKYKAEINVTEDFGKIGAVIVNLKDDSSSVERFIDNISITNSTSQDSINFSCTSWVQPKHIISDRRRIFFSTKSYLPGQTPIGLLKLRAEDLNNLRGLKPDRTIDTNERKAYERIYDYDVYNDLGDPESDISLKRHVLGGSEDYPYPRRCRTGRPHYSNPGYSSSETRSKGSSYVPRDEEFSEAKQKLFKRDAEKKEKMGTDPFKNFTQIDLMFEDSAFQIPNAFDRDRFNWLSDIELARQTLAGMNPYCIQMVKTNLPLKSALKCTEFGPPESKFTSDLVKTLIGSDITGDQAVADEKLFVVDFHDILMPYVKNVRRIKGTTLYGSRTMFYLNTDGTLKLLGIELTRPPMDGKPQWKQVFSPGGTNAKDVWLWRLAKVHVLAHDSCVHQLVSHWLRTHCCMEPYAIALNRQLSTMHPIYRLLHPHFRFNMRINANARGFLISAGGIIETTFSASKYSMELSSLVYKNEWQFDNQALPDDLIRRGMAKEAANEKYGVKLTIKDYPFANDGLILWGALLDWVTDYVNYYYGDDDKVKNDEELNKWWTEIKEKGHPDKKKGWPALKTRENLIKIVTTIAWVGCGHHTAVNFNQYAYAGYFPNRPSIARTDMPIEFTKKPEAVLLDAFPSKDQATIVAKTMMLLSAHSEDEDYIGKKPKAAWADEPTIANAFERFKVTLNNLETTIKEKNDDANNYKNRNGPGLVPYEVFNRTSGPGITGKGVPYSVST